MSSDPEAANAEAIARYFANDLDAVEREEVEQRLTRDPSFADAFWKSYDDAVDDRGLMTFVGTDSDVDECFSTATLQRYLDSDLPDDKHKMVQAHVRCCPLCEGHLAALRGAEPGAPASPGVRSGWVRWVGLALAAGIGLFVLRFALPTPTNAPRFELAYAAGEAQRQGAVEVETPIRLRAGTRLELRFEAMAPAASPPEVQAYVIGGPSVTEWSPKIAAGPALIAVSGVVGEALELGPGRWQVVVALVFQGRDVDPRAVLEAALGTAPEKPGVQYFVIDVEYEE